MSHQVVTRFKGVVKRRRVKTPRRARPDEPLADHCEIGLCWERPSHRHHRLRRSQGGTDDASNTMDLCAAHHRYVHDHPSQSYALGWLKRSTT